jgi:hypothetical protein
MPPRVTVPSVNCHDLDSEDIPAEPAPIPFHEWFLLSLEDGYFDWDEDDEDDVEEKANILRYFQTCPIQRS